MTHRLQVRSGCDRCELADGARSVGQPVVWDAASLRPPTDALVLCLGDRPGVEEDRRGQPFVGASGDVLRSTSHGYYSEIDLHRRAAVYLGNAVRCFTPAANVPVKCYKACRPWLDEDMQALAGAGCERLAVLAMGAGAARQFGHDSLAKAVRNHQGEQHGRWTVFYTLNPAALLREPKDAENVADHLALLDRWLDGRSIATSRPRVVPIAPPPVEARRTVIALDVETYGAVGHEQTVFHPEKSRQVDRPPRLLETVQITVAEADGSPGDTYVVRADDEEGMQTAASWVAAADDVYGHNIPFDVLYLRAASAVFASALEERRQRLIDTSILAYSLSEVRTERSLKGLGRVLGLYEYDKTLADRLSDAELLEYGAKDTHHTLELAGELFRRIRRRYPSQPEKTADETLDFYSRDLWTCIVMAENGCLFDARRLREVHRQASIKSQLACQLVLSLSRDLDLPPLLLRGTGSQSSQQPWLVAAASLIVALGGSDPLQHELLEYTDGGDVSFSAHNFRLFQSCLPRGAGRPARMHALLKACMAFKQSAKVLTAYTRPLLWRSNDRKRPHTSTLLRTGGLAPSSPWGADVPAAAAEEAAVRFPKGHPGNKKAAQQLRKQRRLLREERMHPSRLYYGSEVYRGDPGAWAGSDADVLAAYPSWFPVPGFVKDGEGDQGGTEQGRMTAKGPAMQTLPPTVRACIRGRGYDLVQAELCTAAVLSGEPTMLSEYAKPKPDLHTDMMLRCGLGTTDDPGFKSGDRRRDPRQWAKEPNFLILFWGGAATLQMRLMKSAGLHKSINECRRIVRQAEQSRPRLKEWHYELLDEAERNGFLVACPIYGVTRRTAGDIRGERRSMVVNCKVQTTAGHTMRAIQHEIVSIIDDWGLDVKLSHQIYDAAYLRDGTEQQCDDVVREATRRVAEEGYWARLCRITGNSCPLMMESPSGEKFRFEPML